MQLGHAVLKVVEGAGAVYAAAPGGNGDGDTFRILYLQYTATPRARFTLSRVRFTLCGAPVSSVPADLDWEILSATQQLPEERICKELR